MQSSDLHRPVKTKNLTYTAFRPVYFHHLFTLRKEIENFSYYLLKLPWMKLSEVCLTATASVSIWESFVPLYAFVSFIHIFVCFPSLEELAGDRAAIIWAQKCL